MQTKALPLRHQKLAISTSYAYSGNRSIVAQLLKKSAWLVQVIVDKAQPAARDNSNAAGVVILTPEMVCSFGV